jgi:hypothetical protein
LIHRGVQTRPRDFFWQFNFKLRFLLKSLIVVDHLFADNKDEDAVLHNKKKQQMFLLAALSSQSALCLLASSLVAWHRPLCHGSTGSQSKSRYNTTCGRHSPLATLLLTRHATLRHGENNGSLFAFSSSASTRLKSLVV